MPGNFVRYGDEEDLLHCGLDIDTITEILGLNCGENPQLTDDEEKKLLEGLQEYNERLSNMTEQQILDTHPHLLEDIF
jgi:hypothetical protein